VRRLVRRAPAAADEFRWDPTTGRIDDSALDNADAVVNLAGPGIGDRRWTAAYKREVRDSRVAATTTIAHAAVRNHVNVLVSASAVGWYGDRGDDVLTETEPNGRGFLADLVHDWEAATSPAAGAGVRVVTVRSGIVVSPEGGALGKMLPIFRLGLGGRLGSGRQWVPWIAMPDEVAAIRFAIGNESLSGPVNVTAPNPVTNRELTAALAETLRRPAVFAVPRLALRAGFGEFADEGLLASQRAVPAALQGAGFDFAFSDLRAALAAML
jgi:uncharacterized protein (TIGR01777 family)